MDNSLCLWCEPKRVPSICGDGGDGVMKTINCAGLAGRGALESPEAGCELRAGRPAGDLGGR